MSETVLELPVMPLGAQIDQLWDLKQVIKKKADELKELKQVFEQKEDLLMERLQSDKEQLGGARGSKASVTVGAPVVCANVENWDEFYAYIHRNKAYYLLHRRPADGPYRELLATRKGKPVPGVVPFEKRNLNMVKA